MYADCSICEYLKIKCLARWDYNSKRPGQHSVWMFYCEYAEMTCVPNINERGHVRLCQYPRKDPHMTLVSCLAKSEKRYEYVE